jgi:hypothetical protein
MEIGGAATAIGDDEADVKTRRGDIDLDENPPMMWPRLRAMPKAGADVNGPSAPLVPGLRFRYQRRDAGLEDAPTSRSCAAGKIDDEFWLESEAKLAITCCSHRTSSGRAPSRPKTPRKYHDFSRAMAFLRTHS